MILAIILGFFYPSLSYAMDLNATYVIAPEPLTTEKAWSIDPAEQNPHRSRWMLKRELTLQGLRAVPQGKARYGVTAEGLVARTYGYVRDAGPWYRPFNDYPCEPEPVSWFATEEGTRKAVNEAARFWEETLSAEKIKLATRLRHLAADSPAHARERAERIFTDWERNSEAEWRVRGYEKAKMAEWRYYLESAAALKLCEARAEAQRAGGAPGPTPLPWEAMLEPVSAEVPRLPLVRAPARRWDGLFSVRLTMTFVGKKLDGQFLIDSGSGMSVISPSWLEGQGVFPEDIEVRGAPAQRVNWSGRWGGDSGAEGGLARRATVQKVEMSGHDIPIHDFLVFETDFFNPPENFAHCCDGILGSDFLRNYAVEFVPAKPVEVRLWDRAGFSRPAGTPWIEVGLTQKGEVVSPCVVTPDDGAKGSKSGKLELVGVRWDTGSEMALDIHAPWEQIARPAGDLWRIQCGDRMVGDRIPVTFPPASVADSGPLSARVPATNAGVALLARGPFVFDLAHGRLWFTPGSFEAGVAKNESGLQVHFVFSGGARVLKVKSVSKGSPAERELAEAGLKPGMVITQVNQKPADEQDLWDVEQKLAGADGDRVSLEWETKAGLRTVVFKVR